MARRRFRNIGSLTSGFMEGYELAGRLMRDRDLQKAAQVDQTVTPAVAVDGDPATVRAQLDAGAGMGEARRLAGAGTTPASYALDGQTQDRPFSPDQVSTARRVAQAGVLERHGDVEGGSRLRSQVQAEGEARKRSAREDQRFEWESGDRTRTEAQRKREDAFNAELSTFNTNSHTGQRMRLFAEQNTQYRQDLAEYERRRDAGDTTATPPAKPRPAFPTPSEALLDAASLLDLKVRYGKAAPEELQTFGKAMQGVLDGGLVQAMQAAQADAPLTSVLRILKDHGREIDPNSILSDKKETRDGGVKSRVISYRDQDGSVRVFDTLASLAQFGKAGELYEQALKAANQQLETRRVGVAEGNLRVAQAGSARAAAADGRAAAEFAAGAPERQVRQTVGALKLDAIGDDPAKAAGAKAKLDVITKQGIVGRAERPKDEKSPKETHRELVMSFSRSPGGGGSAVKKADAAMREMGYTRSGADWVAADSAAAAGGSSGTGPSAKTPAGPQKGAVIKGDDGEYEFLGGDPKDPKSYRKVQPGRAY